MKQTNPTEAMIQELQALETILGVLDQQSGESVMPFSGTYSRMYNELLRLVDSTLAAWNEEASCGLHDRRRMLYRCDEASGPYHTTDFDGPCEVYTPNFDGRTGKRVCLCDLHQQLAEDAADKAKAERDEYLLAKRKGEDV